MEAGVVVLVVEASEVVDGSSSTTVVVPPVSGSLVAVSGPSVSGPTVTGVQGAEVGDSVGAQGGRVVVVDNSG